MLAAIAANAVLLAAILGFGSVLCRLSPRHSSIWERAAFTVITGLGVVGTLLFLVGQIWFTRTSIAAILVAGILLGAVHVVAVTRRSGTRTAMSRPPLLPALIIGGVLLTTAVGGLAEPTGGMQSDAIAYHLLGPKVWVREGVIRPVLDESHTSFPAIVETQFGALGALGGDRAPELFSVVALLSLLLVAAALAERSGLDRSGVWWTAALVAAMPIVHRGVYGGFVDAIYSAFIVAALWQGYDSEHTSDSVVFGLLCGFAAGTKYTGLIASALLVALSFAVIIVVRRRTMKTAIVHVLIAGAVAAMVAAPWYLRNWAMLGTPIYPPPPGLSNWVATRYMPPEAIRYFQQYVMNVNGMGRGTWNFLLLPFHLTFHAASFLNGDGGVGLTPLALAPIGLLARRKDWFVAAMALFVLAQTAVWFATEQDARFMIHLYVMAAVLAVWGWRYVRQLHAPIASALAAAVVAVSVSYGFFIIASARRDDVHAVLSSSFAEQRKQLEIPYRDSFAYLNHEPSVTKVLVIQPRVPTFYLDKPYVKLVGRWGERAIAAEGSPERIAAEFPRLGLSHILDVRPNRGEFALANPSPGLTLVLERDDQRVYRVQTAAGK